MIVPKRVASVATKIAIPHQPSGRASPARSTLATAGGAVASPPWENELIGRPPAHERWGGTRGNREVPPHLWRRGLAGETGFPPRERAGGERRSLLLRLLQVPAAYGEQRHHREDPRDCVVAGQQHDEERERADSDRERPGRLAGHLEDLVWHRGDHGRGRRPMAGVEDELAALQPPGVGG